MERRALVLALALTLPLALYAVPYAYASMTTSSYVVRGPGATFHPGDFTSVYATCNSGDYVTGGGVSSGFAPGLEVLNSEPIGTTNPSEWGVGLYNSASSTYPGVNAVAVCQTPITVAGLGVPQFGSLYVAIALGAVVYFMLARRATRKVAPSSGSAEGHVLG